MEVIRPRINIVHGTWFSRLFGKHYFVELEASVERYGHSTRYCTDHVFKSAHFKKDEFTFDNVNRVVRSFKELITENTMTIHVTDHTGTFKTDEWDK